MFSLFFFRFSPLSWSACNLWKKLLKCEVNKLNSKKKRKNYLLSKKQTLGRIGPSRRYCELLTLALFLLLMLLLLAFKRFLSLDYLIRFALVKQERLQESKQYLNWSVHSSLTLTKLWTVSLSSGKKMSRSMTRWLQNKNLQHDLKNKKNNEEKS